MSPGNSIHRETDKLTDIQTYKADREKDSQRKRHLGIQICRCRQKGGRAGMQARKLVHKYINMYHKFSCAGIDIEGDGYGSKRKSTTRGQNGTCLRANIFVSRRLLVKKN